MKKNNVIIGDFKGFKESNSKPGVIFGVVSCKGIDGPVTFTKSLRVWLELYYPEPKTIIALECVHFHRGRHGLQMRASAARFPTAEEVTRYEIYGNIL